MYDLIIFDCDGVLIARTAALRELGVDIVFGALQWARVTSGVDLFAQNDPVSGWFERCLDPHSARGRSVTAA